MEIFFAVNAQKMKRTLFICGVLVFSFLGAMSRPLQAKEQIKQPFIVLKFENRSKVAGLSWMEAGAAMVVADKLDALANMGPSLEGTSLLGDKESSISINAIAERTQAKWLVSGWISRPDWKMELGLQFWMAKGKKVRLVDEYVSTGDFSEFDAFVTKNIKAWAKKRNLLNAKDQEERLEKPASKDFYAFTLFGRGVTALANQEDTETLDGIESVVKNLEKAVFIDPSITLAHRLLATAYYKQGLYQKSQLSIDRFIEERPGDYEALLLAANMADKNEDKERAAELMQIVLEQNSQDLGMRERLATMYWDLGKVDEAFAELKVVTKGKPENKSARRMLVTIYGLRGDHDNVLKELEWLQTLEPENIDLKTELSSVYRYTGREEKEVAMYKEILKLDPKHGQTLKNLGDHHKKRGQNNRARKYYRKSLNSNPSDPRPYFLLGAMLTEEGKDEAATEVYKEAERFKGFIPDIYYNLGAIEYRQGRLEQSLTYLKKAIKERPKQVRFLYNYSLSLSASGRVDEALKQTHMGLRLSPEHKGLNFLHGVVRLKKGQLDEARQAFAKTLEVAPEHKGAHHNLALINVHLSKLKNGVVVENKN